MSESLLSLLLSIKRVLVERPGDDELLDLITGHPEFASQTHELWDRLAVEQAIRMPLIERPSFATIEVGTFKTVLDLKQALTDGKFRISDWVNNLMGRPKFTLLTEPAKLDLYMASNAELGYPNGCSVRESFEALEKIGAVKLPPEAGAQYRLQYADQFLGEWRLMYMDPITDSNDTLWVFDVGRHDDGPWLSCYCADPDDFCNGDEVWVFARLARMLALLAL